MFARWTKDVLLCLFELCFYLWVTTDMIYFHPFHRNVCLPPTNFVNISKMYISIKFYLLQFYLNTATVFYNLFKKYKQMSVYLF